MLAYSSSGKAFVIDPHYLTIIPFRKIWDNDKSPGKKIATALLMWIYHMYNPHSPFRDHRNAIKSQAIVESVFPKEYVQSKLKEVELALSKVKDNEIKKTVSLEMGVYNPEDERFMGDAIKWYTNHLKQTPLWYSYESYKESMYNLAKIIRDPTSSASMIKTASQELDTIPVKMDKMRQQAERDEAMTIKIAADKTIKRGERLPNEVVDKKRREVRIE